MASCVSAQDEGKGFVVTVVLALDSSSFVLQTRPELAPKL